jgi:hypothetical protein
MHQEFDFNREKTKLWVSYWRENIHRFALEYLGLKLHLFQLILLYLMDKYPFFMWIASRGGSKSYLIAVYSVSRAILYPDSKIGIISETKAQSSLIISQKIEKELCNYSPVLQAEIVDIKTTINYSIVNFRNGSYIQCITPKRGFRFHLIIVDEFRLVSKDIIDSIVRPYLNVNRQPLYLLKDEYRHLKEENKEIYISSAYYRSNWMFGEFLSFVKNMCNKDNYLVLITNLKLSLEHNLISETRIAQIKSSSTFDLDLYRMEYESEFVGQGKDAFFTYDVVQGVRTLIKPFYPPSKEEFLLNKDKKRKSDKKNNEIRLISVDIGLMGGSENDLTIITLMKMIKDRDRFVKHVTYIEHCDGWHTEDVAIRIKQLFEDFEADYVAIDTLGQGLSVADCLFRTSYDKDRDVYYDAWSVFNDDKMKSRTIDKNAKNIVFSIKVSGSSALKLNHNIAISLRNDMKNGRLKLLIDEVKAREYLVSNKIIKPTTPSDEISKLLLPYVQTTILQNEMIMLNTKYLNGFIQLKEPKTKRKDRFTSLAYCNYLAITLEEELKKDNNKTGWEDFVDLRK